MMWVGGDKVKPNGDPREGAIAQAKVFSLGFCFVGLMRCGLRFEGLVGLVRS
jgi:hypothetical protein